MKAGAIRRRTLQLQAPHTGDRDYRGVVVPVTRCTWGATRGDLGRPAAEEPAEPLPACAGGATGSSVETFTSCTCPMPVSADGAVQPRTWCWCPLASGTVYPVIIWICPPRPGQGRPVRRVSLCVWLASSSDSPTRACQCLLKSLTPKDRSSSLVSHVSSKANHLDTCYAPSVPAVLIPWSHTGQSHLGAKYVVVVSAGAADS